MSLSKKYGIPDDKIKRLIQDGWISCSVSSYEQIYQRYLSLKGQHSYRKILEIISIEKNYSERWIREVIERFES